MKFYELIKTRESIRDYDPTKPVPEEVLNRILEAGRLAPSAGNRQPWTFVLVSSEKKLKEVRECYQKEWFQQAPHVLVIVGDKSKAWTRSYDEYNSVETDLTIAMDHMVLAAENEGVGTCWIIAYQYDMLAKAVGLKPNEVIYSITPLGYPHDGFKKRENKIRKPLSDIVRRI
jgi:nitroreductase